MYETLQAEMVARRGTTVEEAQRRLDEMIPLRRSNTPDDIANMACFLASAEADNITGQSYNVDGGLVWD
jgi:NAD(P)-dependent dehydrogenase (short-subunit alcohol dehydrogenase family)